ncbi:DUF4434 domain-containing protein [Pseudopedobacter beijingensis]|uniref:DUF4434 domain-containing protein n=1 Tax=Pseudopedobacter beijingensis TaxID=1207056 RepID=A0ABW4IH45_9SPHI
MWGMFRSDLSFYPLELSLWVKSSSPSNNKVIIHLLQQNEDYTLTNDSLKVFSFRSSIDLSKTEWQQITIPYNLFVEDKEGRGDPIDLKRVVGYEFGVENTSGKAHEFTMNFDSFQQFTSFKPTFNKKNKFSSIFIQLHASLHEHLDWEPTFKAYRAVGIDTVILQQAVRNDKTGSVSNYKGTKLPNIIKQYQMIENAFTAATKTGMKVILGLNAGKYPINKNEATVYDQLYEINKIIVDELYNKFSNNKMMVGWYISEEYHDGTWRGWWKPEDAYLLSHYQERVASYAKSKEKKFLVTIAPALWRGRPADMTYEFYKRILEKTPSVDILYLQDCAGRLNILNDDLIIDLPNYFAMVKKACDETGVKFGVDIESFTKGNCTIKRGTKEWEDLKLLLDIAGMYTQNISQFSWHSFRPGIGAFSNYEKYINE